LKDEISSATSAGVLFVTSAGNKGVDISNPYLSQWPAAFTIPGKIVVGSMNPANVLSVFSNYGPLVDLAAPGENILSTYPPLPGQSDDQFGILSGTSMAAPFVSGVAAILFSINPSATPAQVSEAILNSVSPGYFGVRTKGKIDALAAVQYFLSH
jgi:subtilisin family serine protease